MIYNHNKTSQYEIVLDKYWLTQSGHFMLETTVASCMGIKYANILLCYVISEQSLDKRISMRDYNYRKVYDLFKNNFPVDYGIPDFNIRIWNPYIPDP